MNLLKKLFTENIWSCYYSTRDIQGALWNKEEVDITKFHKLKTTARYWCADPFLAEENGKVYAFVEIMDRKKSFGLLGCAEISNDCDSDVRIIMNLGCHASYPGIFKYKDAWYMIPETSGRKTLELYKATDFPYKWEKLGALIENISTVDSTVFEMNDKLYIFIYEPNGMNNTLSIGELDIDNCTVKSIRRVKEYNNRIGRPAGKIFEYKGKYIRPTQYGVNHYGEKIVFKEFKFDPVSFTYREEDVSVLDNNNIVPNENYLGLHTYNRVAGYEIIDRCRTVVYPLRPLRIVCKKLGLFGYSYLKG